MQFIFLHNNVIQFCGNTVFFTLPGNGNSQTGSIFKHPSFPQLKAEKSHFHSEVDYAKYKSNIGETKSSIYRKGSVLNLKNKLNFLIFKSKQKTTIMMRVFFCYEIEDSNTINAVLKTIHVQKK